MKKLLKQTKKISKDIKDFNQKISNDIKDFSNQPDLFNLYRTLNNCRIQTSIYQADETFTKIEYSDNICESS